MGKRTLTIIDTSSLLTEADLDFYDKEIVHFGRDDGQCDIVVRDPIISKFHGTFYMDKSRVLYRDENSSNGTWMASMGKNRKLGPRDGFTELYDKSVLRIGDINHPGKMVLILYRDSGEEENWRSHPLGNAEISIGRDAGNQIELRHPGVSKKHCVIRRSGSQTILFDQGSLNGVLVNGHNVSGSTVLHDKDIIQILDFQLIYSQLCIYYRSVTSGISLYVDDITKVVGRGRKRKKILQNVNCEIKANEFVAIIGGSGAGKTTLMNAISGFEKEFTGNVYCNGIDLIGQFHNLKSVIGFVPQQDIIYESLTLKKMLLYTAKLKMPADTQKAEMEKRIAEVLDMVDLREHQNTYIRKLSGGQKKRASIAVELLADPKLFFLDEPTSGLDPGTEKNLMTTLSSLSKTQNKTIVMVTHTTQNLHLCDKVIFMGPGGRLCFAGNVEEAKAFYHTDDLVNIYNMIAEDPQYWQKCFADQQKNRPKERGQNDSAADRGKLNGRKKESAFRQFMILTERYGELIWNDRPRLLLLLIQPFLIALLLKIVADDHIFDIYESTKSMLFALSCSGIWIGMFNSIQEICKERVILKREYMANLKLPCYMLSKFVLQAILGLVQSAILALVFLNLVGKKRDGLIFPDFRIDILLTIWLTVLASVAMGFIISSVVRSGDKAMAAAPFVLIVQLLFSGILFNLEGAGESISYCTVSRWSVEALGSIARLNKLELKMQADFPMLEHEAESIFRAADAHIIQTWGILAVMTAVLMAAATMMLRNVAKDRR